MASLKVIATDDEPGVLLLISDILRELEDVELIGTAQNAADTIKLIQEKSPDIAFLDINLPDMQGFDLASILQKQSPDLSIIFVTAYKDFSLKAFEIYATDYILKPIDPLRIKSTLRRIQIAKKQRLQGYSLPTASGKISLDLGNEKIYIKPSEIIFIERIGRKSHIHCLQKTLAVCDTLQGLEQRLGARFFRSHKSYLVNMEHILKIITCLNSSYYVINFRDSDKTAYLSRNRSHQLMELMES